MNPRPNHSVGLGGDGDEIAAIGEVEAEFGVTLDYADAHNWTTAGDVYAALRRALPPKEADKLDLWDRFADALCRETGVQPSSLTPESELLCEDGVWMHVANGSAILWSTVAAAALVAVGWLLLG
ncbi:hypothetical protein C7I55_25785 [Sphingomonas deserti]|uniref:Uncharacterized protein n=1 Tax=Allosphingosinicella deserti TaxID=2116704 RepID=A0A2P7QEU0_9SPHN|nr:hypothetical protein C7I55_25785 [Sphingomonas deserti]